MMNLKTALVGSILGMAMVVAAASNASAACTEDPWGMGMDAAELACIDIIEGWIPYYDSEETTCTPEDEVLCKRAMRAYLRSGGVVSEQCGELIRDREPLYDSDGNPAGNAFTVWFRYVRNTCNL